MLPKQIAQLLRSQVIPWTAPGARRGIVVARKVMRAADMPEGVTLSRQKIAGQRVVMKDRRQFGNRRYFTARWPQANLQELTLPKMACVISGTADYLLGDGCVHCGPGSFILMPPFVPHQAEAPFSKTCDHTIAPVMLHAIAHQHGVLFWYLRSHTFEAIDSYLFSDNSLAQLLHLLMEEASVEKKDFDGVAANILAAFFTIIAREIEAGNYVTPGPKEQESLPARSESFAEQVQVYIEANCHRMLRVEDAARHMYMSCSQFSRRMRRETGITFVELLTRVRMERACKMLRETEFTNTIITALISYRSDAYFETLFRSRMGCTPMEYRRQHHNKSSLQK